MITHGGIFLAGNNPTPPDWCLQSNAQGQLPVCTYVNGQWYQTFPGSSTVSVSGATSLIGGLAVLVFILGAAVLVWKVTKARSLARQAGMSTSDATAMTLLTEDGLAATYLASNLRSTTEEPKSATQPTAPSRTSAERLTELQQLFDSGLVTREEYDARRQAILDEI